MVLVPLKILQLLTNLFTTTILKAGKGLMLSQKELIYENSKQSGWSIISRNIAFLKNKLTKGLIYFFKRKATKKLCKI